MVNSMFGASQGSRSPPATSTLSLRSSTIPSSPDDSDADINHIQPQRYPRWSLPARFHSDPTDYVLVIGGLGYIGSHTVLELLTHGYNVIVIDNLSNAFESVLDKIQALARKHWSTVGAESPVLRFHKVDYRSPLMKSVLESYNVQNPGLHGRLSRISGVIHFAAYKSVVESIHKPLDYYLNNVCGLVELLCLLESHGIYNFVFSSSAVVYASKADEGVPLREEHLVHHHDMEVDDFDLRAKTTNGAHGLTSPYGRTKYFGEAILADVAKANPFWRITALRYFNPVGCAETLGEDPRKPPTNLFPVITRVLTGRQRTFEVFGSDYPTTDGTAVRDFIHVADLARAHVVALSKAVCRHSNHAFRTYNVGSGTGSTVAQVIASFEKASGTTISTRYVGRREGDVGISVAATQRAERELGWSTKKTLAESATDTWESVRAFGHLIG